MYKLNITATYCGRERRDSLYDNDYDDGGVGARVWPRDLIRSLESGAPGMGSLD